MNVTEQPHAPGTLPLHGPQDLVWTEKCDGAGIRTRNRPAFNLDAVLTALSIHFKHSNYTLVFHSFVQITRYSENHVYLVFGTP